MRIGFMGSPEYSVPTLKTLQNSRHDVVVVYSQPPQKKGRGQKLSPCSVHQYALDNSIPIETPVKFKDLKTLAKLKNYNVDVLIVVAYGIILPKSVLEIPKYGCINGHASLLPRWRGAAPIHRAIQHGDSKTGVCIMQMDTGLDTGDILQQRSIAIEKHTTIQELHDILSLLSAELTLNIVNTIEIEPHTINPIPQSKKGITYAHKIQKEEKFIDWNQTSENIHNMIRAFTPFPSATTHYKNTPIKVIKSCLSHIKHNSFPGTIISLSPFLIACNNSTLEIQNIQKPGKKPISSKDFINSTSIEVGESLT